MSCPFRSTRTQISWPLKKSIALKIVFFYPTHRSILPIMTTMQLTAQELAFISVLLARSLYSQTYARKLRTSGYFLSYLWLTIPTRKTQPINRLAQKPLFQFHGQNLDVSTQLVFKPSKIVPLPVDLLRMLSSYTSFYFVSPQSYVTYHHC